MRTHPTHPVAFGRRATPPGGGQVFPVDGTLRFPDVRVGGFTFDIALPFGHAGAVRRYTRSCRGVLLHEGTTFDFRADDGRCRRVEVPGSAANVPDRGRIGLILVGPPGDAEYLCGYTLTAERAWYHLPAPSSLLHRRFPGWLKYLAPLAGGLAGLTVGDWRFAAAGAAVGLVLRIVELAIGVAAKRAARRAINAVLDHVYNSQRYRAFLAGRGTR